MITAVQFKDLKKGNISVNAEESKERIPEAFKSASKAQKDEILKLSGLAASGFYSVKKSGTASPKTVLSLAQILDISPKYLTGEIDEKLPCDAAELAGIFAENSVNKKSKPIKAATPKPTAKKAMPKPTAKKTSDKPVAKQAATIKTPVPAQSAKVVPVEKTPSPKPVEKRVTPTIDGDTLTKLLEALAIRAKFSDEAKVTYNQVVELLVK